MYMNYDPHRLLRNFLDKTNFRRKDKYVPLLFYYNNIDRISQTND